MLILLPPSEGKAAPRRGKPLDLPTLDFPGLTAARERVLDALVELCEGDPDVAAKTLGLGSTQVDLVDLNRSLRTAPTARADQVYTGVLYDALDVATLSTAARAPGDGAARGHLDPLRAGPPERPDPGVPALRRRHPARPRPGRRRLARAARRRR